MLRAESDFEDAGKRRRSPDDDGYQRLREAIVKGDLAPNQRLVEADMSNAFRMPRAAVRTALVRLEHEGLVEREPHRGARVRLVSEAEAVEILQARAVLEGLAARAAAERITRASAAEVRAVLTRQRAALNGQDLLGASDVNAALHAKIVELSGHSTAQRLIRSLNSQMVRFQYRTILIPGRPAQSLEEHSAIVEAVASGDGDKAERAMRRHLTNVAKALESSHREAAGDSAPRRRRRTS
ncbi:MAG TPA: GntR family transcriptional regulator [Thermoleophilaceae bacterium]